MTDRLGKKAREIAADIGYDPESALMGYYEASEAIHAALLSARGEALEEAARVVEMYPPPSAFGEEFSQSVAREIRSLKSKVTP